MDPHKELRDFIAQYVPAHSFDRANAVLKGVFEGVAEMRRSIGAGPEESWDDALARYTAKIQQSEAEHVE